MIIATREYDTSADSLNHDLIAAARAASLLGVTNDENLALDITSASEIIAELCDRDFALQTLTETFRITWPDHPQRLNLYQYPVTEITSVTEDDVTLVEGTDYAIDMANGILVKINGHFRGTVVADYSGGFDLPTNAPAMLARAAIENMRTEFTAKVKAAAALRSGGHCECCTRKLLTGDWHYDHEIPDALGGEATFENCRVLCRSCHANKTITADIPRIAKAHRNFRKARGIRKSSRFACAKASPYRKKLNGEVVRR